jgi:hypothetical protein
MPGKRVSHHGASVSHATLAIGLRSVELDSVQDGKTDFEQKFLAGKKVAWQLETQPQSRRRHADVRHLPEVPLECGVAKARAHFREIQFRVAIYQLLEIRSE